MSPHTLRGPSVVVFGLSFVAPKKRLATLYTQPLSRKKLCIFPNMSNPYNAKIIPKNDVYSDVPLYGRFESTVDDFDPTNKTPQEILQLCGPANEMLPEVPVRRIYALGKVIIKGLS